MGVTSILSIVKTLKVKIVTFLYYNTKTLTYLYQNSIANTLNMEFILVTFNRYNNILSIYDLNLRDQCEDFF